MNEKEGPRAEGDRKRRKSYPDREMGPGEHDSLTLDEMNFLLGMIKSGEIKLDLPRSKE